VTVKIFGKYPSKLSKLEFLQSSCFVTDVKAVTRAWSNGAERRRGAKFGITTKNNKPICSAFFVAVSSRVRIVVYKQVIDNLADISPIQIDLTDISQI